MSVSNQVFSGYSDPYNKMLDEMVLSNPTKSLEVAKKALLEAELSGDSGKQLESIYYIVSSFVVLANSKEISKYLKKGMLIATQVNNVRYKSEFISFTAKQSEIEGRYNSAVIEANKALRLAYETKDERLIASALSTRGQMYVAIENYDLALADVEKALTITKNNDDDVNTSTNYNLLAIIYDYLEEFDIAIKYYQESDTYDKVRSDYDQATLQYNIGATYVSKKDYGLALEHYNLSKKFSINIDDVYSIAFVDFGIAEVYLLQKKVEKSEATLLPVFKIFESMNDLLMLFNSNLLMAEINILNEDYILALSYIDNAEKQAKLLDTTYVQLNLMDLKLSYYLAQEKWKDVYGLKVKINKLEKEIQEKSKEKSLAELKIRFNAQFDKEKLKFLKDQNQLQQNALTQEKIKQKYLWGLIGLGVVLLMFTFLGYRNQMKIKKHLYDLSIIDYLTQVSNRRHIIEKLKGLYSKNTAGNFPFAIIMIDLDFFKKINDSFGHDVGNEVLIYFAKTAKETMQGVGTVGRIGGEEWLILMPNTSFDFIRKKLEELRHTYKKNTYIKIPKDYILSFSSGVIMSSDKYKNHEEMLTDVDMAMYEAKKKGREQDVYVNN